MLELNKHNYHDQYILGKVNKNYEQLMVNLSPDLIIVFDEKLLMLHQCDMSHFH